MGSRPGISAHGWFVEYSMGGHGGSYSHSNPVSKFYCLWHFPIPVPTPSVAVHRFLFPPRTKASMWCVSGGWKVVGGFRGGHLQLGVCSTQQCTRGIWAACALLFRLVLRRSMQFALVCVAGGTFVCMSLWKHAQWWSDIVCRMFFRRT